MNDTNVGIGMYYNSPEEREIQKLTEKNDGLRSELTAALRRITELEKESQSWKDAHGVAAFDRSQLEAKLHEIDVETKDADRRGLRIEHTALCNRIQDIIHPAKP